MFQAQAYLWISSIDLVSPYLVSIVEQSEWNGHWYLLSLLSLSKLSSYSECRLALAQTPGCYQLFLELLSKHHQKQVSTRASSVFVCLSVCVLGSEDELFQCSWCDSAKHVYLQIKLFMYLKSRHIYGTLCSSARSVRLSLLSYVCVFWHLIIAVEAE